MLVILLFLCFGFLFIGIRRRAADRDPREAFLSAAVAWGVITVVLSEGLSLVGGLTTPGLALGWGIVTLVVTLWATRLAAPSRPAPRAGVRRASGLALAVGAPIVTIMALTGIVALLGWPNQIDSFGYHLSRVAHWIQNRSVAFYPTHITHQLYYPPWAEYAMLQFTLLGWDERLTNLVQWFSMVASLVGGSLIARELGAGPRGQAFGALFCATLPMGILQASTTQNDYVTGFWLVCLAHGLLAWRAHPAGHGLALRVGASLGLALLTKGVAYLFAAPLLLCLLLRKRPLQSRRWLGQVALSGLVMLALNAPQYARNLELFGGVLGPVRLGADPSFDDSLGFPNESFSLSILTSNVVRNAALHAGTPSPGVNAAIERLVTRWHAWLGIDVSDPRTTWGEAGRFFVPRAPASEDLAGNPVHLLVIVAVGLVLVMSPGWREHPRVLLYALSLLLGFMLFSALLKWQAVHSRLHLPLFVLASPLVGLVFQAHPRLFAAVAVLMLGWAAPFLISGRAHPLLGEQSVFARDRLDQSFRYDQDLKAIYTAPAEFVRARSCSQVGLITLWNGLEYVFWLLLPEVRSGAGRLEHVAVTNSSARLARRWPPFRPCAVIVLFGHGETLDLDGRVYRAAWSDGRFRVFLDEEQIQSTSSRVLNDTHVANFAPLGRFAQCC